MATPPSIPRSTPPPIPRRGVSSTRDRHRPQQHQQAPRQDQEQEVEAPQKKRIEGLGFWIITTLAIVKDAVDMGLTTTVIGAFFVWMLTGLISLIVGAYFWINGVHWNASKVGTAIGTFTLELVPFLSAFPIFTAGVIALRIMTNNEALASVAKTAHGQFTKSGK